MHLPKTFGSIPVFNPIRSIASATQCVLHVKVNLFISLISRPRHPHVGNHKAHKSSRIPDLTCKLNQPGITFVLRLLSLFDICPTFHRAAAWVCFGAISPAAVLTSSRSRPTTTTTTPVLFSPPPSSHRVAGPFLVRLLPPPTLGLLQLSSLNSCRRRWQRQL